MIISLIVHLRLMNGFERKNNMYQIITETRINGIREMDSVYTKTYKRRSYAEKNARGSCCSFITEDGRSVEKKAYVRGFLFCLNNREIAKEAYCQGMRIWVDGKYGQIRLPNSWEYGSHAPAFELFNRSVEQVVGYGYEGNFYVEDER